MIERKFRDLVRGFLCGEISPAETSWMVEDLHRRRERRDLFIEMVEEYLEDFPVSGEDSLSVHNLRELLLRDLTTVDERDIQRAVPRHRSPIAAKEIEEEMIRRVPAQEDRGESPPRRREEEPAMPFDAPEQPVEDRSYALPLIGILTIIVTFVFMVRFSSLEGDSASRSEDVDSTLERELSDSEAVRRAEEFLAEQRIDPSAPAEEESLVPDTADPAEAQAPAGIQAPVSLSDLVGRETRGAPEGFPVVGTSVQPAADDELYLIRKQEP